MQKRTTVFAGVSLVTLAGAFACVIALLIIPGIQLLPLYRIEPEDILPAAETVLLMHAPSSEDLDQYKKTFPALDDVISDAALDAVAIVRIEHATQSIGFVRKSAAWDGKSCEVGPYVILSAEKLPCPTVDALDGFLAAGPRLSNDRGWKMLRRPSGPWTFLRREALPHGTTTAQRVAQAVILGSATHILHTEEALHAWPTEAAASLDASSLKLPAHVPRIAFASSDTVKEWGELAGAVDKNDALVLEGVLLDRLASLAGPSVSLRHGLLPLMAFQSELHVGTTASGGLSLLLSGTAQQGLNLDERIEELHRSFALRHPSTELLRFAFDDGRFPFATLRMTEAGRRDEEQIRGWSIQISRDDSDESMLITARSDRQVALSNDPEALRRFLMEEGQETPFPTGKKTLIGRRTAGMVLPNALLTAFGIPEEGKSIISVEQNGEVRTVRMAQWRIEN